MIETVFGLTPAVLLLLLLVAFLAGFIDAVAGGGGMLTIPALLTAGLPPHMALGTNKLCASFGSVTASLTFYRRGIFQPRYWLAAAIGTAIGAMAGTLAADQISAEWLNQLLPLIIIITAIYALISKPLTDDNQGTIPQKRRPRAQWLQGISIGFYDGVAGPGTGSFWTLSNMALYRMNLLYSSGLARVMNCISNVVSLLTFAALGHVNLLLGASLGFALMIGAYVGARSAISLGSRFIRPVFTLVVLGIACRLVWQNWMG
ncbi:TSUP family transporter [Aestuariirhabdus sp. Z084]|uniref:TSUP family transporter n=1 Tax=Aestuariirhabdus haliotis TaxID=2918751 RepID=UPI00201B42F8|nr:TSUP family transporter [Aestuariirhabdus haliotis]MCL6414583.1 TSUP family transporter [Aestuariirhabdus haliotis]MCL6418435.1 TSUP family transporter [Aestuariirhabdus haliotis]